jgi:hypothetical protein
MCRPQSHDAHTKFNENAFTGSKVILAVMGRQTHTDKGYHHIICLLLLIKIMQIDQNWTNTLSKVKYSQHLWSFRIHLCTECSNHFCL